MLAGFQGLVDVCWLSGISRCLLAFRALISFIIALLSQLTVQQLNRKEETIPKNQSSLKRVICVTIYDIHTYIINVIKQLASFAGTELNANFLQSKVVHLQQLRLQRNLFQTITHVISKYIL